MNLNSLNHISKQPGGIGNLALFSISYDRNPHNVAEFLDF
jgi:hypothetical protein